MTPNRAVKDCMEGRALDGRGGGDRNRRDQVGRGWREIVLGETIRTEWDISMMS